MTGTIAVWMNAKIYTGKNLDEAKIGLSDRGLLLGDGLFETLPILKGEALWLEEHLDRIQQSAEKLAIPTKRQTLKKAVTELAELSSSFTNNNGICRLTITRGSGGRGLLPSSVSEPVVFATLAPLADSLIYADASLVTASNRRNEFALTSQMKTLNYLDNILAAKEAEAKGADDALMLNTKGEVACSTIANIFAVFGQTIITPPQTSGILPGITRSKLLTILPAIGLKLEEAPLTQEQIKKADGLFLTNSLRMIRRITSLDDKVYQVASGDVIDNCQNHLRRLIATRTA